MPKSFYRRRSKLKPEDWTEEIEKWERVYQEHWFIESSRIRYEHDIREEKAQYERIAAKIKFDWKKEKEHKQWVLDSDGKFCGHFTKSEMNDGIIICWHCGKQLGRRIWGSVGYNNRHHTMRGQRSKKK